MEKHFSKLTPKSTYSDVKKILDSEAQLNVIPVIESHKSKLLIGTCHRNALQKAVNHLISNEKRYAEAERRAKILQKVFNYRYTSPQSQPALTNGQTTMENHRNANSTGNLEFDHPEYPESFTVMQATQGRGWQLAKQAVADKRIHKLAIQLDVLETQQDDQQTTGKRKRLKKLARKIADVKGKTLPDLYGEKRIQWEEDQLKDVIDLHALEMDTAPFCLIAGNSLLNVYSLFSLLCLNSAYVTNRGILIGVVSLAEIHQAVDDVQKGMLFPLPKRPQEGDNGDELNLMKNIANFRRSFRRRARQSIVQFMETDENPWINQKWSQNIASGMENKQD